jgi:hypothetical protein
LMDRERGPVFLTQITSNLFGKVRNNRSVFGG